MYACECTRLSVGVSMCVCVCARARACVQYITWSQSQISKGSAGH